MRTYRKRLDKTRWSTKQSEVDNGILKNPVVKFGMNVFALGLQFVIYGLIVYFLFLGVGLCKL